MESENRVLGSFSGISGFCKECNTTVGTYPTYNLNGKLVLACMKCGIGIYTINLISQSFDERNLPLTKQETMLITAIRESKLLVSWVFAVIARQCKETSKRFKDEEITNHWLRRSDRFHEDFDRVFDLEELNDLREIIKEL